MGSDLEDTFTPRIPLTKDKFTIITKPHKCTEPGCSAAFSRPNRLKNHKLTHSGERPFKCDFSGCNKSYTNQAHLKRHKNISHTDEIETSDGVVCDKEGCGRILANKYSLKKHIARNHCEDNLPFKCTECNKRFKRKSILHSHLLEHGKEAPYKCEFCNLTFAQNQLYQKHIRNHKTYQCDCNKEFNRWTDLCRHRKTECVTKTQHSCIICGKTFSQKQNLTQHALVHIQESQTEVFKCPYLDCKSSYKYKKNLNHHIKVAHEKMFNYIKCTEKDCDVVLKSKKNLKQHLRTCHNGLPPKERKPRKTRKDKGSKMSFASKISGFKTSAKENLNNTVGSSSDLSETPQEIISVESGCNKKSIAAESDKQESKTEDNISNLELPQQERELEVEIINETSTCSVVLIETSGIIEGSQDMLVSEGTKEILTTSQLKSAKLVSVDCE